MYNTKEANAQINSESKYLSAGIHDNVYLTNIRVDKSPMGNKFLEITFSKDDKQVIHTEWEPKMFNGQKAEDFNTMCNRQLGRLLQILNCYYPKDKLEFSCNDFDELTQWVNNMLKPIVDKTVPNIPVRLKVVFNKRGFTTLPSYAKYTFIEPMNLKEGETSKIEKLNIDLFERPIQADKETSNDVLDTPKTATAETATANGDLPF